jgi:hypothetical protein
MILWRLIIPFITSVFPQKTVNVYSTNTNNFITIDDCLFLSTDTSMEKWNTSSFSLITSVLLPENMKSVVYFREYRDELYMFSFDSPCFFKIKPTDLSLVYRHCNQSDTFMLRVNFNYLYVVSVLSVSEKVITILNKTTLERSNELIVKAFMNCVVDDKSMFILSGDASFFYVTKYDLNVNFIWKISLSRSIAANVPGMRIKEPFIYIYSNGLLILFDYSSGVILREIAFSDLIATSVFVHDQVIFLLVADSRVFLVSQRDATLLNIYGDEEFTHNSRNILVSNNHVFLSTPDISSRYNNNCFKKYNILQKTIDLSLAFRPSYSYTKAVSKDKYSFRIKHESAPRRNELNSAMYLRRWNNLQIRQQNAFFNPVLVPTGNNSAHFFSFSGAGSCERSVCESNLIKTVNITSFDRVILNEEIIFDYRSKTLFNFVPNVCCALTCVPDKEQMVAYASLFDYGSILLAYENIYYYIIHSGCPCYNVNLADHVIVLELSDTEYTYLKGKQNENLKR